MSNKRVGGTMLGVFVILGIIIWFGRTIDLRIESEETKPYTTYTHLIFVASGCDKFKEQNGVFPSSLAQLHTFRPDLNDPWTKDAWGRDVVIVPYDKSLGYGEVVSYGRDGNPGGVGLDSDLAIRFPTETNAAWNKQQAEGLKKPRFNQ